MNDRHFLFKSFAWIFAGFFSCRAMMTVCSSLFNLSLIESFHFAEQFMQSVVESVIISTVALLGLGYWRKTKRQPEKYNILFIRFFLYGFWFNPLTYYALQALFMRVYLAHQFSGISNSFSNWSLPPAFYFARMLIVAMSVFIIPIFLTKNYSATIVSGNLKEKYDPISNQ